MVPLLALIKITSPTLVIVDERDLFTPHWLSEEIAREIPGAKLARIEGTGAAHAMFVERSEDDNNLIVEFFRSFNK